MPLKRCKANSKDGWKWGDSGKCYTGKDAKSKALAQGRAIEMARNKKRMKKKMKKKDDEKKDSMKMSNNRVFQQVVCNLAGAVRFERLEGREYLVAPMVMLTEGVHAGSLGPIYYPPEQIQKSVHAWNHKPIVVYHPDSGTACDPIVLENRKVGIILNTIWDDESKKLRAEAWIDIEKAKEVDDRILDFLEEGKVMEVSTGLFHFGSPEEGVWNGEQYVAVVKDIVADHLALLPDKVGACSVQDGAGLLQLNEEGNAIWSFDKKYNSVLMKVVQKYLNAMEVTTNEDTGEMSLDDLRESLFQQVQSKFGRDAYLVEVFKDFVIFEDFNVGKMYRVGYSSDDSSVSLNLEAAEEVIQKTTYVPVKNEETKMTKEELISFLIANEDSIWEESDAEALSKLSDEKLEKMAEQLKEEEGEEEESTTPEATSTPAPQANPEKELAVAQNQKVDAQSYIQNAPPEIREMLESGLAAHQAEKKRLISTIVANENNRFTEEQLQKKPLGELQAIAELARSSQSNKVENTTPDYVPPFYAGVAGGADQAPVRNEEDVYIAPTFHDVK